MTTQHALFGMGCFWGAERRFWQQAGVINTSVGYAGGKRENPNYDQVCTGATGHAEVVYVEYDPQQTNFKNLLKVFWESHDPTQGNRQGNDIGTQYRSVIYTNSDEQLQEALASKAAYEVALKASGFLHADKHITTQIEPMPTYYLAEDYHQKYLQKNPNGYCGLRGTGVSCTS